MKYVSTRGQAPKLNFEEVLMTGRASDGGLYVPEEFPKLSTDEIRAMQGKNYAEVAFEICRRFTSDVIPAEELRENIRVAYEQFDHAAVVPLKQLSANGFLLELFHGPTLAFKDVAMQLIARLMDRAMARGHSRVIVLAATSGDTGGAAVEAFKHNRQVDLFVLYPHGKVSDVQRRQMTTVQEKSVHNIAFQGTFDDCQAIVKTLFADTEFRTQLDRRNQKLSGVNSINWGRIMAQIVYYFYAGLTLGAPDRAISFTVPTGNFGNIFAALVAKRMGLPIDKLVIATNSNDILDRTLKTGRYEVTGVHPTSSPSMDIQVSSNFERLVYLANNGDSLAVCNAMNSLKQAKSFTLTSNALESIRSEFSSGSASDEETQRMMNDTFKATGELVDPHTAVGLHVAMQHHTKSPMVVLATAHPAKFPDAVRAATGETAHLPLQLQHLMTAPESFTILPNSAQAVKDFILSHEGR